MQETLSTTIAIDGPAASGKSTLGKKLADKLGYLFFDTGVMYRAVTWVALANSVAITDEPAVSTLAEITEIDIRPPSQDDERAYDVLIDGQDATWEIRSREVEANVSAVSAYAGVRRALTQQQRRIGLRGKVVMVGRDIGSVVVPEASFKIYLDASAEERARRRYREIIRRGELADYEEILEKIRRRDQIDSTRDIAPLSVPKDAIVIDSDCLDADQVYEKVIQLFQQIQEPS